MNEEFIERQVERRFDALDARLMRGELSQAEYDEAARKIARDADRAYADAGKVQTTCIEHAMGATTRLSFQIKVF